MKNQRCINSQSLRALFVLTFWIPGCILIGTSEHRVKFNEDGSGEAFLRLIDIRSDEVSDSAVTRDFQILMNSFETEGVKGFQKNGRKILRRHLFVRGDTLGAEIVYSFPDPTAVEGLRVTPTEMYIVVSGEREVVRTNGKVTPWMSNELRIVWKKGERRLSYVVREKTLPPSVSLAPLYLKYTR